MCWWQNYSCGMDWKKLISELHEAGKSLRVIGSAVGLSPQCVMDIEAGRQQTVRWEVGDAIIRLHRKTIKPVRQSCKRT